MSQFMTSVITQVTTNRLFRFALPILVAARVLLWLFVPRAQAATTLTQFNAGATIDISADSAGGPFTDIGPLTVAETAMPDFNPQGSLAFRIQLPTGFEFDTETPATVTAGGDFNVGATIFPSPRLFQVTLGVTGTENLDTLTIGGGTNLFVRPTAGTPLAAGNIDVLVSGSDFVNSGMNMGTVLGTLNVVAGALDHLIVRTAADSATANTDAETAVELKIAAKDLSGNIVTTYSGSKDLTFSGPSAAPDATNPTVEGTSVGVATAVTFAAGVSNAGAETLAAPHVEVVDVDVTNGGVSSAGAADDLALTVAPGAATNLVVSPLDNKLTDGSGSPTATQTAGTAFSVRVTTRDQFNNPVTDLGSKDVQVPANATNATNAPDTTPPTLPLALAQDFTGDGIVEIAGVTLTNAGETRVVSAIVDILGNGFAGGDDIAPPASAAQTVNPGTPTAVVVAPVDTNNASELGAVDLAKIEASADPVGAGDGTDKLYGVRLTLQDQFENEATNFADAAVDVTITSTVAGIRKLMVAPPAQEVGVDFTMGPSAAVVEVVNNKIPAFGNYTITANLANVSGPGTLMGTSASVTVGKMIDVSINDPVVPNEGNAGEANLDFTVTLSQAVTSSITLNVAVVGSGGNPTTAADFGTLPTTLVIAPGDGTSKTLSIPIKGDTLVEPDETFEVTLSVNDPGDDAINLTDPLGAGGITNDDSATISITSPTQSETDGVTFFDLIVSLDADLAAAVTFDFATVDGTASSAGGSISRRGPMRPTRSSSPRRR